MSFPSLATFTRRHEIPLAGTEVYINSVPLFDLRTSFLDAASNPVGFGELVQFTSSPPTIDSQGRATVTAVNGSYTAALLAGIVPNRDTDSRVRDIRSLAETPRTEDRNPGLVQPRDSFGRYIGTDAYWVATNLAANATVSINTPVHVLPSSGGGGIVSSSGGTPTPNLRFLGMLKVSGLNGKVYAAVQMITSVAI